MAFCSLASCLIRILSSNIFWLSSITSAVMYLKQTVVPTFTLTPCFGFESITWVSSQWRYLGSASLILILLLETFNPRSVNNSSACSRSIGKPFRYNSGISTLASFFSTELFWALSMAFSTKGVIAVINPPTAPIAPITPEIFLFDLAPI